MKNIFAVIILLIVLSCNSSKVGIDKQFIEELAKDDFELPSRNGFLLLFISVEKNEKIGTNVNVLHSLFLQDYSKRYNSFKLFLNDALNQKITFSKEQFFQKNETSFKLSEKITSDYLSLGIQSFVNQYCEKSNKRSFVKSKYHNDKDLYSILYYCFINNYKVSLDDYSGDAFVEKIN
ncbi:MAG: hypothetical protein EOO42_07100 [Flavobacteriales bacterium]|nr:MAG: hypothetical protein EOO42_07100 [Flavobacteriales bacterium]